METDDRARGEVGHEPRKVEGADEQPRLPVVDAERPGKQRKDRQDDAGAKIQKERESDDRGDASVREDGANGPPLLPRPFDHAGSLAILSPLQKVR